MTIGVGLASVLAVLAAVAAILFVRQMRLWWTLSYFPGPTAGWAYPLVGHAYLFESDPRAFFEMLREWALDFQTKHPGQKTGVGWMGPVPAVATVDSKDIETILSSSKQLDKGLLYQMLIPWLGDGLLLSKGKKWQTRRKLLTPSFHFSVLNSFIDIFDEKAGIFTEKMCALAGRDSPVDIFPLVTRCTLDVICGTAMGINIGAQEGNNEEYVRAVVDMSDLLQERQKYPWLWPDAIYYRLSNGKRFKRHLQILHSLTKSVIQERLEQKRHQNGVTAGGVISNGSTNRKRKMAFLDLLLELHDEDRTFTIDDVREEVDTFMFEGHDTTAAAISWALFMLGHHPEVQAKVHKELDDVFRGDRSRSVTQDDIQKLQYLGCVIKETLRLYPSVPIIGRQLEEDTYLKDKFVPKGTLIIIGIFILQRDPDHFPEPNNFNPDNFLPENVEGRDPFAYVPFSAGPRNCIGQKFALMEEKVILATLLRRVKVRSLQTIEEVCPIGEIILRPYGAINMEISLRR